MKILLRAVERDNYLQVIAASLLTVFGIMLVQFSFQRSTIMVIAGLSCTIIGGQLVIKKLKQLQVEDSQLVHLLFNHPEKIVWVYGVVTQHHPFGFSFSQNGLLYFKLINGEDIVVDLPAKKLKQVSRFLNKLLPYTCFGYTKEREKQYLIAPSSLKKYEN